MRGDLADRRAVDELVRGAAVVVHAAGIVSASHVADYHRANALGTEAVVRAMLDAAGPGRLVLVSSLAAREPGVSAYARSKLAGEAIVLRDAEALRAVIVRPPAVYGPGDRATLPLFSAMSRGLLVVPGARTTRFSMLFVDDLAELLARLVAGPVAPGALMEPDDGTAGGYGWADVAAIAQAALGRRVRLIDPPRAIIWPVAVGSEIVARLAGGPPFLGREKLGELLHEDWVASGGTSPALGWAPTVRLADGFRTTMAWYKQAGWL